LRARLLLLLLPPAFLEDAEADTIVLLPAVVIVAVDPGATLTTLFATYRQVMLDTEARLLPKAAALVRFGLNKYRDICYYHH
jgi:hypothetical protein